MDLKQILDDHRLWLDGKGGKRANLSGADLRAVDLSGANLCRTNLCLANLRGANLHEANLREADLSGAIVMLTPDVMKALGVKT